MGVWLCLMLCGPAVCLYAGILRLRVLSALCIVCDAELFSDRDWRGYVGNGWKV